MKSMKKIALGISLALATGAHADISWSSTGPITNSDGTTPLVGDPLNKTIGYFVQLVFAGANNTPDPAINTGVGAGGDDVVVSSRWIGALDFVPPSDGAFGPGSPWTGPQEVAGSRFFVRAWNAPSASFNDGDLASSLIPVNSPTLRYGDSALFVSPGRDITVPPDGIPDTQPFDAGAFSTTLQAVPEPGTLGLMGIGALGMYLLRRRRNATGQE